MIIIDTDTLRTLYEIFLKFLILQQIFFCTVYYPTSHWVIMKITSIYMVLQNYLSYEIFNDTIFAMIEIIKKIFERNTFDLLYCFNCGSYIKI